ncbi:hypothetical protein ABW20_dc0104095 [Dactylellina cionopaga]|nr:hypothetical protein ABW20_dc0104095 [Dactylellina cionopaga]
MFVWSARGRRPSLQETTRSNAEGASEFAIAAAPQNCRISTPRVPSSSAPASRSVQSNGHTLKRKRDENIASVAVPKSSFAPRSSAPTAKLSVGTKDNTDEFCGNDDAAPPIEELLGPRVKLDSLRKITIPSVQDSMPAEPKAKRQKMRSPSLSCGEDSASVIGHLIPQAIRRSPKGSGKSAEVTVGMPKASIQSAKVAPRDAEIPEKLKPRDLPMESLKHLRKIIRLSGTALQPPRQQKEPNYDDDVIYISSAKPPRQVPKKLPAVETQVAMSPKSRIQGNFEREPGPGSVVKLKRNFEGLVEEMSNLRAEYDAAQVKYTFLEEELEKFQNQSIEVRLMRLKCQNLEKDIRSGLGRRIELAAEAERQHNQFIETERKNIQLRNLTKELEQELKNQAEIAKEKYERLEEESEVAKTQLFQLGKDMTILKEYAKRLEGSEQKCVELVKEVDDLRAQVTYVYANTEREKIIGEADNLKRAEELKVERAAFEKELQNAKSRHISLGKALDATKKANEAAETALKQEKQLREEKEQLLQVKEHELQCEKAKQSNIDELRKCLFEKDAELDELKSKVMVLNVQMEHWIDQSKELKALKENPDHRRGTAEMDNISWSASEPEPESSFDFDSKFNIANPMMPEPGTECNAVGLPPNYRIRKSQSRKENYKGWNYRNPKGLHIQRQCERKLAKTTGEVRVTHPDGSACVSEDDEDELRGSRKRKRGVMTFGEFTGLDIEEFVPVTFGVGKKLAFRKAEKVSEICVYLNKSV